MSNKLLIILLVMTLNALSINISEIHGINDPEVETALIKYHRATKNHCNSANLFNRLHLIEDRYTEPNPTVAATLQKPFAYPVIWIALKYAGYLKEGDERATKLAEDKARKLCQERLEINDRQLHLMVNRLNLRMSNWLATHGHHRSTSLIDLITPN